MKDYEAALDAGIVHYGDLQGTYALRDAVAKQYRERNAMDVSAEEILITNGVTQSAFAAIMTLVDEGDEVIVLEPYYPQHNSKIEFAGGRVVSVPMDRSTGFRLDVAAIEKAVTGASSMIILINPSNPIGIMYSEEELLELSELCIRHDLAVLSDEVYELLTTPAGGALNSFLEAMRSAGIVVAESPAGLGEAVLEAIG